MTPTHKELLDAAADAKFADREQNLRFKIALQSTRFLRVPLEANPMQSMTPNNPDRMVGPRALGYTDLGGDY